MSRRHRLRTRLAALGAMLLTACGSSQTAPDPTPAALGAVHVSSAGEIRSYAISPRDGRLALVGTVVDAASETYGPGPRATDPDGRFLLASGLSRIQAYAVGRDGSLTRRADLSFGPALTDYNCGRGARRFVAALSVTRQFAYLLSYCNVRSQTWYAVDVFAIGSDGGLTPLGSTFLGSEELDSGPFLVADPSGQVVYRQQGREQMLAEPVRPDGTLAGPPAELQMPSDWSSFRTVSFARGFLIVGNLTSIASVRFETGRQSLELRSRLQAPREVQLVATAFGPTGVVVERYRPVFGQGAVYEDEAMLYGVGPEGELTFQRAVPDPAHYYGQYPTFHPSLRFAYARGRYPDDSLEAFTVAADGQLSLLQEIPDAKGSILITAPPP